MHWWPGIGLLLSAVARACISQHRDEDSSLSPVFRAVLAEARSLQPPDEHLLLMNWGRKSHFKRIGPRESVGAHPCTCKSLLLQAASVFRGHGSRPNRAEGNLYVHGSRSGRAEGALNVQPTCLGVQRILCTVKLPRNSTY